ncbi:hypothetical protein Ddye_014147 [Dipteronia dyeriana]|uniref:F-box domain-containing protein n=1 Tax=Dipteronia dyeriana TaxID=168575 RepID=A0AAD9X7V5_9ROSI|nr:hypothetical protein Ddye_014147 [Dipteronia dyeriana]
MEFLQNPIHAESITAAHVSSELIVDILSRLSVKSLCRFRCVSKSWLALITHPRFVRMHLTQTQREKLFIRDKKYSFYSVDLESITYDVDKVDAAKIDITAFKSDLKYMRLWVGSCNGLLCINLGKCLWLYNPSTRERKQVPDFRSFYLTKPAGFGYADSIDDYKFVKLHCTEQIVDVYSLRKNSWTTIKYDLCIQFMIGNGTGISLNGAIHWAKHNSRRAAEIIAFDLVEEKFKTLPLPSVPEEEYRYSLLGVFRGYLCSSKANRSNNSWQFWIMKEYGVKESWTRILKVDLTGFSFCHLQPLCYLKDSNKVVLYKYTEFGVNTYERLVFYNQEYQKVKEIDVDGIQREVVGTILVLTRRASNAKLLKNTICLI